MRPERSKHRQDRQEPHHQRRHERLNRGERHRDRAAGEQPVTGPDEVPRERPHAHGRERRSDRPSVDHLVGVVAVVLDHQPGVVARVHDDALGRALDDPEVARGAPALAQLRAHLEPVAAVGSRDAQRGHGSPGRSEAAGGGDAQRVGSVERGVPPRFLRSFARIAEPAGA
jgi:hypothetical protein